MNFKRALQYHLSQNAGVVALVGTRIYEASLPQSCRLPALTYQQVGSQPSAYQGGACTAAMARIQLSCFARRPGDADALKEAVRLALDGFKGAMGPAGDQISVMRILHGGDYDGFAHDQTGADEGTNFMAIDFECWYRQAVPA